MYPWSKDKGKALQAICSLIKDFLKRLPDFYRLKFSCTIQQITLPAGPFALFIPDQQAVKNNMVPGQDPPAGVPYWTRLWPSAIALAGFLQHHTYLINGKRVAEIGAGIGLPSLIASQQAASVWCSDLYAEAMEVAAKSASHNRLANIRFEACNWNHLPDDLNADVVLLSDINYEPTVFDELEKVLRGLLQKGCTLVLATPQRLMAKPFIEKLLPFVVSQTVEAVQENGHFTQISIFVLKIN